MPLSSGKAAAGALETAPDPTWLWGQVSITLSLSESFPCPCTPSRHGGQGRAKWPAVQCSPFYFLHVLSHQQSPLPLIAFRLLSDLV